MAVNDWIREHAKWAVPGLLAGVGLYINKLDGKVLSYETNEFIIYIALFGIWYMFNLLKKDHEIELTNPPEVPPIQPEVPPIQPGVPPIQPQPTDPKSKPYNFGDN